MTIDKTEKEFQRIRLKNKQKYLDRLFEKFGLTDEILLEQVKINKARNMFDIPDAEECVDEYVQ